MISGDGGKIENVFEWMGVQCFEVAEWGRFDPLPLFLRAARLALSFFSSSSLS